MKIVEIFLKPALFKRTADAVEESRPTYYAVGQALNEHGNPVKEIKLFKYEPFGVVGPAYVVSFEGSPRRQTIPPDRVLELTIDTEKDKKPTQVEEAPDLPD